jgi:hypothetical protein
LSSLRDHTQTYHTRQDSSGRVISQAHGPLPDKNTTFRTDFHALGGIRTRNTGKLATADPRLRPRGHWDRHFVG